MSRQIRAVTLVLAALIVIHAGSAFALCDNPTATITSLTVIPPVAPDNVVHIYVGYAFSGQNLNQTSVVLWRDGGQVGTVVVNGGSGTLHFTDTVNCWAAEGDHTYKAKPETCGVQDERSVNIFLSTKPWVSEPRILSVSADKTTMDIEVDYRFPYVSAGAQNRKIHFRVDDGSWGGGIVIGSDKPWEGSITTTVGTSCLPRGTHSVQALAVACNMPANDIRYRYASAPMEFEVDPVKITSLDVTGPDPAGLFTANVGYEFQGTSAAGSRDLYLRFDNTVVTQALNLPNISGTVQMSFTHGCITPGVHTIRAQGIACGRNPDPLFHANRSAQITAPSELGEVTLKAVYDAPNDRFEVSGTYSLPPGVTSAPLVVRALAEIGDDGDVEPAEVVYSETVQAQPGTFSFNMPRRKSATAVVFKAELTTCNTVATASATAKCPCEAASNDPVFYTDGNMRYQDADPLPPLLDSVNLGRTYDSNHGVRGAFGRGWNSMFDSRLYVLTSPSGDTISLTTPGLDSAVFVALGGVYKQSWPTDENATGTLTLESATSLYLYRPAGSTTAYLFRSGDGRYAGRRELGSGRELRIDYTAGGLPAAVSDSWTGVTWTITANATSHRITSIEAGGGLVWQYQYDATQNLTAVLAPGGGTWRTYEYTDNRMTAARDAAGKLIESHNYDSSGRAIDSTGPGDEIANIDYRAPGTTAHRLITRVTQKSGAVTEYHLEASGGAWRPVAVIGGCSSCGSSESTSVYDDRGHVVRRQNGAGYVTLSAWVDNRLVSVQEPLAPSGCDPNASPTQCRLDSASLATAILDTTSATTTTTLEYNDAFWPDRVTGKTIASVLAPGQLRREWFSYDPASGTTLTSTVSGWTLNAPGTPVQVERISAVTLYGSQSSPSREPAFDPGGVFLSDWLGLPQPLLARRSVDGPRADVQDVTVFVHYPVDASVPASLRGRLAAAKNAAGHVTRYESYDLFGNATRVVDPNGVASELTYDALGRLLTSTAKGVAGCDTVADPLCAADLVTTRAYFSSAGPLTSEIRPGGGVTAYEYDSRGRLRHLSRGPLLTDLRERMEHSYDALTGEQSLERLLAFEDGVWVEKKRESFGYDGEGRLETVTQADGATVSYVYDAADRIASVRAEGHSAPNTTWAYDAAGRLNTVTQTLTGVSGGTITTVYAYDIHGNLTSVTDPNGNVTTYAFDDFGQAVSQTSPVTGVTSYRYDSAGNLLSTTDANNAVTTRTYDVLGRILTASSVRGSATEAVSWSYDDATPGRFGIGRPSAMTDPAGATTYSYERRGLLRSEQRAFAAGTATTTFGWDSDGNRSRIGYPSGTAVQYAHDHAGRPVFRMASRSSPARRTCHSARSRTSCMATEPFRAWSSTTGIA